MAAKNKNVEEKKIFFFSKNDTQNRHNAMMWTVKTEDTTQHTRQ